MGEMLYHYCTFETFRKIVDTGKIRFVDAGALGDPDAMTFLWERYVKRDTNGAWRFREFLMQPLNEAKIEKTVHLSFSLTEEDDSPYMWRMYAKRGKGVCIGFDEDRLEGWVREKVQSFYPDDGNAIEGCRAGARFEKVRYLCPLGMLEYLEDGLTDVNLAAPFVKHESFRHESEHRAVITMLKKDVDFSLKRGITDGGGARSELDLDGEGRLRARIEWCGETARFLTVADIPFDRDMIGFVRLGPDCGAERNRVTMYLDSRGCLITNYSVLKSGES